MNCIHIAKKWTRCFLRKGDVYANLFSGDNVGNLKVSLEGREGKKHAGNVDPVEDVFVASRHLEAGAQVAAVEAEAGSRLLYGTKILTANK